MSVYTSMARFAIETGGRGLNKKTIAGMEGGYVYLMYIGGDMSDNLLRVAFSVTPGDDASKRGVTDFIRDKDNRKRLKVQSVGFSPDGFRVVFTMSMAVTRRGAGFAETMREALREFAALLGQNGLRPGCSGCGAEGVYQLAHVEDMFTPLCDDCFDMRVHIAEDRSENRKLTGNYFSGFVGALLGSIVGVVVYVVVAQFGYVAAVTGIVTAICAAKGYSLLRGRVGYGMPVIVFIVMLISIFAGVWADYTYFMITEFGAPFGEAAQFSWQMMFLPTVIFGQQVEPIWTEAILPGIFSLAGGIPIVIGMVRSTKNYARIPERIL